MEIAQHAVLILPADKYYIGIMENQMETTGIIGFIIGVILGYIGVYIYIYWDNGK